MSAEWGWIGGHHIPFPRKENNSGFDQFSSWSVVSGVFISICWVSTMDPAPSFPCFSLVHSVTLLVQKRKTMRARLVSVSFQSRRTGGERLRFCQSLGTEDRVESRDAVPPLATPKIFWLFLWMWTSSLYLLTVQISLWFLSTLFYLLGIEKRNPMGSFHPPSTSRSPPCPFLKWHWPSLGFHTCLVIEGYEMIQNESRSKEPPGF